MPHAQWITDETVQVENLPNVWPRSRRLWGDAPSVLDDVKAWLEGRLPVKDLTVLTRTKSGSSGKVLFMHMEPGSRDVAWEFVEAWLDPDEAANELQVLDRRLDEFKESYPTLDEDLTFGTGVTWGVGIVGELEGADHANAIQQISNAALDLVDEGNIAWQRLRQRFGTVEGARKDWSPRSRR